MEFQREDVPVGFGVRSPHAAFRLTFNYKSNKFFIENRLGTNFVAEIRCVLDSSCHPEEFELYTITHFKNIFLRRKNRISIQTKSNDLEAFIQNNCHFQELSEIAKADRFDPQIRLEKATPSKIIALYHLELDDYRTPLKPMIGLIKDLIDRFASR